MGTRTSKGSSRMVVAHRHGKHIVHVALEREVARRLFVLLRERCITASELVEDLLGPVTITLEGENDGGDRAAA